MNDWWINDKEPGEKPYKDPWYRDGTAIFLILIGGVVALLWVTW